MSDDSCAARRMREHFERVKLSPADAPATRRYASAKLKLAERWLNLSDGVSILDLGCGNGVFSVRLAERGV
ncbi:MAG: hypothetical protein AB1742_00040 [bacterium]